MSQQRPTEAEITTFCSAIVEGKNHTQAFYMTYPKSKAQRHTAHHRAYDLTQTSQFPVMLQRVREIQSALLASNLYGMRGSRIGLLAQIASKGLDAEVSATEAINAVKELNRMQDSCDEVVNNRKKEEDRGQVKVILAHDTELLPGRG